MYGCSGTAIVTNNDVVHVFVGKIGIPGLAQVRPWSPGRDACREEGPFLLGTSGRTRIMTSVDVPNDTNLFGKMLS